MPWSRKPTAEPPSLRDLARARVGGESIGVIAAALRAAGFSAEAYRTGNDDLRGVLTDDKQAIWHFLTYCGGFTHVYPLVPDPDGFARICALRVPGRLKADVLANLLSCFSRPGGALWTMPSEKRRALLGALCQAMKPVASIYIVAGDSHSNLYREPAAAPAGGPLLVPLHILCTGSSARGLPNRASRSGSGARLAALAEALPDHAIELLFKFGQVDVEFNFNFDRIRAGASAFDEAGFARFAEQSVTAYVGFLQETFAGRPVNVMSIFPPVLSDAAWRQGYTNAQIVSVETEQGLEDVVAGIRDLAIPSLIERTRHHAIFNGMLAGRAAAAGFAFLDDFSALLGPCGTADARYVPTHQGRDHHLEFSPTTQVLSALLGAHLARRRSGAA